MSSPTPPRDLAISGRVSPLCGEFRPPSDKSVSIRALLVGALAEGASRFEYVLDSADTSALRDALRRLGVVIEERGSTTLVHGRGWPGLLRGDPVSVDVGESGTAARVLLGVLAATERDVEIRGRGSLLGRPMLRVVEPLRAMSAIVESIGSSADRLPLRVRPSVALRPHDHHLAVASAQVKSALLFAGCATDGVTVVREPVATRDHSERMLAAGGVSVDVREHGIGREISIRGRSTPHPLHGVLPADTSSALYAGVLATCVAGSKLTARHVLVNPTRCGAIEVLRRMGARIEIETPSTAAGEPIADLRFFASELAGVDVAAHDIPSLIDDVPALAVAAAFARCGETRFRSVGELRVKESDRIATTLAMLRRFGCAAHEEGDDLVIPSGCALRPGRVDSAGDHRIALAALTLALAVEGDSLIVGFDSVAKSYPDVVHDFARLGVAPDRMRSAS